jgi:hypothetical protein
VRAALVQARPSTVVRSGAPSAGPDRTRPFVRRSRWERGTKNSSGPSSNPSRPNRAAAAPARHHRVRAEVEQSGAQPAPPAWHRAREPQRPWSHRHQQATVDVAAQRAASEAQTRRLLAAHNPVLVGRQRGEGSKGVVHGAASCPRGATELPPRRSCRDIAAIPRRIADRKPAGGADGRGAGPKRSGGRRRRVSRRARGARWRRRPCRRPRPGRARRGAGCWP